jgi:hypothetical protein
MGGGVLGSATGDATDNSVTIDGATFIYGRVVGGVAQNGNDAQNNTVTIKNGTFYGATGLTFISGGWAPSGGDAEYNTLIIMDGDFNANSVVVPAKPLHSFPQAEER